MAKTVAYTIRMSPELKDALVADAKRAGKSVGEWLWDVYSVYISAHDVHTLVHTAVHTPATNPALEPVHTDVHSVHTPVHTVHIDASVRDVPDIRARWELAFPQAELTDATIDLWLSMADVATILRMIASTDRKAQYRTGPGVARYASKVLDSFVSNPLPPLSRPVTDSYPMTEKEPITAKDRARWKAVDDYIAEHGSPWPDWDKIEAERQARERKGDE